MPRDDGLAIALTEKLEDMVSIIFLPLVSRMTTDGLMNSKIMSSILHSLACPLIWVCLIMVRLNMHNDS